MSMYLLSGVNVTVAIFALCTVLATVLVAIMVVRRFKKQLSEKMEKLTSRSSFSDKNRRFRKRDKIAFYGRKMLRKVAESVEEKRKMIPRGRLRRKDSSMELGYSKREPSEYFLDPESNRFRSNWSSNFLLGNLSGPSVSDDIPMEFFYLLRSVRVFGYLERPLFLEICKYIETKHVSAGMYLFNRGDPDDTIFVVQTGKVVVSIFQNDKDWPIREVTCGESIYSLLSFLDCITGKDEKLKTVSAKAVCDSTVVKMPFSAFIPVFEKYPETMIRVIQVILVRLQRVTFDTLHRHLGLCEELIFSGNNPNNAVGAFGSTQTSTSATNVPKASLVKTPAKDMKKNVKNEPLHKSSSAANYNQMINSTNNNTIANIAVDDVSMSTLSTEIGVKETNDSDGSRDASPSTRFRWSSVTFDPSGRLRRRNKVASARAASLMNNDEFSNVLGRARLDKLDAASNPSYKKQVNNELSTDDIKFYHPPPISPRLPRPNRSQSLTHHSSQLILNHMNKLSKQDVKENVYIEAAQLFAKALGLPANKSYLLNDKLQLHNCSAGSVLLQETSVDASLILLLHGSVICTMTNHENVEVPVCSLSVGDMAGALSVLTGEPNIFSVKAKTNGRVVVLSKEYFYELVSEVPSIVLAVAKSIVAIVSPFVRQADFSLDWMQLEGGKSVYKQGDKSDATYLVINGRLRSVMQSVGGSTKKELLGEYGRGDLVGMVEVLTSRERKTSVHTVRDTELAVIPVGLLDFMKTKYPSTVARLIQILSHTMIDQQEELHTNTTGAVLGAKTLSNISTVAIVPSNDSVPLTYFTLELLWCLNAIGSTIRLTSNDIVNRYGEIAFESVNDYKLSNYLSQVEDHHRIVLYQTDKTLSSWTQRCIRQADCIIIVAVADQDPKVGEIEKQVDRIGMRAQKELVLLYKQRNGLNANSEEGTHAAPENTVAWLNNRDWVTLHHHVRCKHRTFSRKSYSQWLQHYSDLLSRPPDKHSDYSRLARHLTGTSVGLILGGGGARGAAHLGVIRSLVENDIPIDMIGGTSIGSLVGAIYAQYRHKPLESFISRTRSWFMVMSSTFLKLFDLTYPHTSFFSGKLFNSQIRCVFNDLQIEDLWIPYFCVTTDITVSCIRVHTSGDIWRYVRSSMSLSGYLPPVCDTADGHLLLDGGYVNNLPADIMKELWNPKRVIAVDVGSQDSRNLTNYGDHLSGFWVIAQKWNPFAAPIRVPGMEEIQSRLAYVLCKKQLEEVKNSAYCDYVRPPIDKYKTLSFGLFDEIYQLGYAHALTVFQQWMKADYFDKIICSTEQDEPTVFQNELRVFSKRDTLVDEFAGVAARLSGGLLSSDCAQSSSNEDEDVIEVESNDERDGGDEAEDDDDDEGEYGDVENEALYNRGFYTNMDTSDENGENENENGADDNLFVDRTVGPPETIPEETSGAQNSSFPSSNLRHRFQPQDSSQSLGTITFGSDLGNRAGKSPDNAKNAEDNENKLKQTTPQKNTPEDQNI